MMRPGAARNGYRAASLKADRLPQDNTLTNLTNPARLHGVPFRIDPVTKPVNIYDAKTHLSELVDRAAAGEEIVIAKAGQPMARLVPLQAVHERRVFGRWAGQLEVADDFDAPLPDDLLRAFEGDDD